MDFHRKGSLVLALTVLTAALDAQDPPKSDEALDQQVQEMRRQMTEGKVYRSHVRVTVRLKNGNRMQGIVKDGFVVERIYGMRFVAAEASEDGAGMRLFYWNGARNFVFLPFSDIQEYRINARLSSQQLAQIEREALAKEAEELRKQHEANAIAAARAAETAQANPVPLVEGGQSTPTPAADPAPAPAPAGGDGAPTGVGAELQALFALMQEYPPAAGWSQAKRDEIMRRKAVIGANPTAQEQKFVERFADWQRACTLFGAKPVTQEPADDGGDDRRGRRRR